MTPEELTLIRSKRNAAIIAPAGHGKTEMITDLVNQLPGKKLVLTHTNAGISALTQRLKRKAISTEKYTISTISSFCQKWCNAYPSRARVNLSIKFTDKQYYTDQYNGTSLLFSQAWARDILQKTYSCVIVDEYQDCVVEQHLIFLEINRTLPVYVLGDPLQSIFGWAGQPVSWKNLGFEIVTVGTKPYRWMQSNNELGEYLTELRSAFLPALAGNEIVFKIPVQKPFISIYDPRNVRTPEFYHEYAQYKSVLFLTKWPKAQCAFAQQTAGFFQNDEPQNLQELYRYAERLDGQNGHNRAIIVLEFASRCATQIQAELGSYIKHINEKNYDFSKIKKHKDFGKIIYKLIKDNTLDDLFSVLDWIRKESIFRIYRRELFFELMRSFRLAQEKSISIHDAAQQIRMIPNNQRHYANFSKLSSRAVLSKGLEFECVIIDLADQFSATEMYVAMTRAMKRIIFISNKTDVLLSAPLI